MKTYTLYTITGPACYITKENPTKESKIFMEAISSAH